MAERQFIEQSRQLLTELQGDANCPKFRDLSEEQQKLLAIDVVNRLGFGLDFLNVWFDGYFPNVEKSLKMITEDDIVPRSILMSGPVGVGKTCFLSAMIKSRFIYWAMKSNCKAYILPALFAPQCVLVTHQQIIDINAAQYREEDDFEYSIQDIKDAGILMIDGFCDNVNETEANLSRLYDILNYRYEDGSTTWITTNISADDLKVRQGHERIYSRFTDDKWIIYVEVNGENRRGK